MANLFIIGNGFDLAHNMKTQYSDFRKYLIKIGILEDVEYSDNMFCEIPEYSIAPDGDELFNETEAIKTIITCIDKVGNAPWKNIEKSLGVIDYSPFFQTFGLYDGEKIQHEYNRNEASATNLYKVLKQIHNYFYYWLDTIEPASEPLSDFQNMINAQNDLFLNFNYTKTLETIYGVKNICHIHGFIGDEKIYLGHGNDKFDSEYYSKHHFGSEYTLRHLHEELKKNTEEAYDKNKEFFKEIIKLNKQDNFTIFTYGFSFSDVDEFYLNKIFRNIDTSKVILSMNDFDKDKLEDFKQTAKRCGYEGKFSTFHINPLKGQGLFKNLQSNK